MADNFCGGLLERPDSWVKHSDLGPVCWFSCGLYSREQTRNRGSYSELGQKITMSACLCFEQRSIVSSVARDMSYLGLRKLVVMQSRYAELAPVASCDTLFFFFGLCQWPMVGDIISHDPICTQYVGNVMTQLGAATCPREQGKLFLHGGRKLLVHAIEPFPPATGQDRYVIVYIKLRPPQHTKTERSPQTLVNVSP